MSPEKVKSYLESYSAESRGAGQCEEYKDFSFQQKSLLTLSVENSAFELYIDWF